MFDIFGESISFTFEGNDRFRTKFGSIVSLICISTLLVFWMVRTLKFINKDDPFFSMIEVPQADTETVNLWELGFMFAVQDLPPSIGTIEMNYVNW